MGMLRPGVGVQLGETGRGPRRRRGRRRAPDRPVSRDELLNKVWGYARNLGIETRTVDIHIAKLRRKIESDPASPRRLVTVRGAGYRLLTQ